MIEITQYQIVPKDKSIDLKYNGQTINFERRKIEHQSRCVNSNNHSYKLKLYQTIREQGGFDNFEFVILEIHLVNDMSEARVRERYWYDLLKCNMNTIVPNRSQKEYQQTEEIKIKLKEYDKKRKQTELYKQWQTNYRQTEQYRQQQKAYQQTEGYKKALENNKTKIICECGLTINKGDITTHRKRKKHIDLINAKI